MTAHETTRDGPFDLCIIGAGITGLNALFVACEHLPATARVALVDRNPRPGGMWTETYPHVRLHQPHGAFTVGDIAWDWDRAADYLATGEEVAGHLADCLDRIRPRLALTEMFGQSCEEIVEAAAGVRVRVRNVAGDLTRVLRAERVIDARGLDVPRAEPLPLGSRQVLSTTPDRLDFASDAPVFIVGGGKTGMDTAHEVIRRAPGRAVTMLTGKGTIFASRDFTLPSGAARHWRGRLVLPTFRKLAMRFDGTNADAVFAHFRETYAISPTGGGEQFFFGILSEAESATIRDGASAFLPDYLEDVRDGGEGPEMILRSGARQEVPGGSVFVNCTGSLLRRDRPYCPYLSEGGRVLTITPRSAVHFLSSVAGYFLPHLFLTDRLREAPLYEMDLDALRRIDRKLMHVAGVTHTFHNTLVLIDALPFSVLDRCGLDLDRWFPLHRRAAALVDVKLNGRRYLDHARRALDRVRADHGIACGPLPAPEAAAA